MKNPEFTPGPWEVRRWNATPSDVWPENRTSISDGEEALFINARYAKNTEANANLVSAAPELYNALMEIIRISDRDHIAWDAAKAALAKARGEV